MTKPKIRIGDAIEVMWLDSNFTGAGWLETKELREGKPMVIRSVCICMGYDDDYLHTVADRCESEDGVMRDMRIPIGCIQSMRRLK